MRYTVASGSERQEMLKELGLGSLDELYAGVPEGARLRRELDLPKGVSEFEAAAHLRELAARNKVYPTIFRGAGSYRHLIPAAVKELTRLPGFVTSYTPYQAELSQGWLLAMFEYQTMIAQLTGMEVSNASVYDGATAAAESFNMAADPTRRTVLVSSLIDPSVRRVLDTYAYAEDIRIKEIPAKDGLTDPEALKSLLGPDTAAVYIEQPNYLGLIEDLESLGGIAHAGKAKYIVGADPSCLGILKSPGECGADIAVGELQPLGIPLSYGGPYGGYMCAGSALFRKLPGRIVGKTTDRRGNPSYVLTLQAREQHIRREKASSSICSNEALCALTAAVYLACLGPQGLTEVGEHSLSLAHYALDRITAVKGFARKYSGEFFNEFVISSEIAPDKLNALLDRNDILGPLPLGGKDLLFCVTEANTAEEIDRLAGILREAAQ